MKVLIQNYVLSRMPHGSQIPESSGLIDRCGNNFDICDGAFGLLFPLDGMCQLINKNLGFMSQEKGRFSVMQLTDIPQSSFFPISIAARHL